ncbi:MAG: c-type cytochrome [Solirubrobacteraceae bacterium]
MLWVVLALWLGVGGGVLLFALAGGPAGVGRWLVSDGVAAGRLRVVALVVVGAAGIAVPIAVAVANGHDRNRVGPGGVTLTASEATGRELFARTCATCHTLAAAAAVGHVGPDLDILVPNEALVLFAIKNGFARGSGQMPAGIYTGKQATDVAQFVAAVAGGGTGHSTPSTPATPSPTSPITLGRQLYTSDGCASCHSLGTNVIVGPGWRGLYGSRVNLSMGRTIVANPEYLTTHIVDPDKYTVKGFPKGVMAGAIASYGLSAKPKQVRALVEFIKSLR